MVAAKAFVGIGLIIAVSWNVDFSSVATTIRQAGVATLAIALSFFVVSRFLEGVRLYVLSYKLGCGFRAALEIIFVSTFFNNFTVSLIGDGYKVVSLRQLVKSWRTATVIVIVERLLGIFAIFCIGSFVLLIDSQNLDRLDDVSIAWERSTLLYGAGVLGLLLLAGFTVLWRRRRDLPSPAAIRRELAAAGRPWQIGMALLLTILAQIALTAMVFWLALALGAELRFSESLIVMLVVFVMAFVPISIGSLGVREGAIVIGLGWFGVPATIALAAALISRVLIYACAALAGAWWAVRERAR